MKKFIYLVVTLTACMGLVSCGGQGSTDLKWEYKVIRANGVIDPDYENHGEFAPKYVIVTDDELNELGADGWELVGTYNETETTYPNWGNEKYVTGIQPNVRTKSVTLIFKRPASAKNKDTKKNDDSKKKE